MVLIHQVRTGQFERIELVVNLQNMVEAIAQEWSGGIGQSVAWIGNQPVENIPGRQGNTLKLDQVGSQLTDMRNKIRVGCSENLVFQVSENLSKFR